MIVTMLGVVLLASAALTVWVNHLAIVVAGANGGPAARVIDLVLGPLLLFFVLLVLYRALPARALSWRHQIPGAIVGTIGIEIIKRAFTFWAANSAGVSAPA